MNITTLSTNALEQSQFQLQWKMANPQIIRIIIFSSIISRELNGICASREKRSLIFPRGNPTRHQFIAGFGVPLPKLAESVVLGYVMKAQYYLPYNTSQLRSNYTRDKRSVEFVEPTVLSETNLVDAEDPFDDDVRWSIYSTVEILLNHKGINGKQCLLRSICELKQFRFHFAQSGLMGELLEIFFSPSSTSECVNDYRIAEDYGSTGAPCSKIFSKCEQSLTDIFSQLITV